MKKKCLVLCGMVAMLIAGSSSVAFAQGGGNMARIRKVSNKVVRAPEYRVQSDGSSVSIGARPDRYSEITLEYETAPDWVDQVEVTMYAQLKDTAGRRYRVYSSTTSYVNVAKGRHISKSYIHPTAVARYGRPEKVGAIVRYTYNGQRGEVASDKQKFWESSAPEAGMLIRRVDSPFALIDIKKFEQVAPKS